MNLHDTQGRRLYLTADERRAFIAAAATADRPVRTLCTVLHDTGCRISEALALTSESIDLSGRAVMFESLKKRRRGIYRAVPVPPTLLDTLDMVHGIREAQKRGGGQSDRPLWGSIRFRANLPDVAVPPTSMRHQPLWLWRILARDLTEPLMEPMIQLRVPECWLE